MFRPQLHWARAKRVLVMISASWIPLIDAEEAKAALIASDSFLTTSTATTGNYLAGNINTQTATNGTTGYYTGSPSGSQVAGWNSGTGAFLAKVGGLSHPLVVNAPTSNDGSFFASGNANNRLQYRDFASLSPVVSNDYYFSLLLSESSNSYTGTVYAGLGPSRASGANATVPNTSFQVGFANGALTLFYNTGLAAYTQLVLLAAPTANSTYLAEVYVDLAAGTLTPTLYNSLGTVVNNPATQTVTATLNASTDFGAFNGYITSNFNGGSPANVVFDEFRFGTVRSDVVVVPEPGAATLLIFGSLSLFLRRRRPSRIEV